MFTKDDHDFLDMLFGNLTKHVDMEEIDLGDDDSCCDHLVILATSLVIELVQAVTTLNRSETLCFVLRVSVVEEVGTADAVHFKVKHECLTEHLSPLGNVVSDLLASVSGGTVVSEGGGGHGVLR